MLEKKSVKSKNAKKRLYLHFLHVKTLNIRMLEDKKCKCKCKVYKRRISHFFYL